jgi:hypothetical protein
VADIPGLAVLRYGTPHYDVVKPGSFVLCAVTGDQILLDALIYWSEEFQEAYRGAPEATAAFLKHRAAV